MSRIVAQCSLRQTFSSLQKYLKKRKASTSMETHLVALNLSVVDGHTLHLCCPAPGSLAASRNSCHTTSSQKQTIHCGYVKWHPSSLSWGLQGKQRHLGSVHSQKSSTAAASRAPPWTPWVIQVLSEISPSCSLQGFHHKPREGNHKQLKPRDLHTLPPRLLSRWRSPSTRIPEPPFVSMSSLGSSFRIFGGLVPQQERPGEQFLKAVCNPLNLCWKGEYWMSCFRMLSVKYVAILYK